MHVPESSICRTYTVYMQLLSSGSRIPPSDKSSDRERSATQALSPPHNSGQNRVHEFRQAALVTSFTLSLRMAATTCAMTTTSAGSCRPFTPDPAMNFSALLTRGMYRLF